METARELILAACLLVRCGGAMSAGADEPPAVPPAPDMTTLQVVDLVIVSTNRVIIGTNTMSVGAAARLLNENKDDIDVAAVHREASRKADTEVLEKLFRVGVPLVVVEKDGEYIWKKQSGEDGMRTVNLGTEQWMALQRMWGKESKGAQAVSGPALQATTEINPHTGDYEITGMELGLFGKRVWVVQEESTSDDEPGITGIRLKKTW